MNNTAFRPRVAAIILTKNEERDLPDCLRSLRGFISEIYVIDSGSTDATVQVALQHGAKVLTHPFESHAKQINWGIEQVPADVEWILRIDADERVHPRLASELLQLLPRLGRQETGILVPLRIRFMGRDMRFGDMYPVWLLRVWRNGEAFCEDRDMDERMILKQGYEVKARGDLIHEIPKNLTEWTAKHNAYASREVKDLHASKSKEAIEGLAGTRRRLKESYYLRLPLFYRAFAYWFYRYFLKLGFLDGKEGLIYHFLQGFWYRFLVDAKLYELSLTEHAHAPISD